MPPCLPLDVLEVCDLVLALKRTDRARKHVTIASSVHVANHLIGRWACAVCAMQGGPTFHEILSCQQHACFFSKGNGVA